MNDLREPQVLGRLAPTGEPARAEARVPRSSVDVLLVHHDGGFTASVTGVLRRHAFTVLAVTSTDAAVDAVRQGCAPRVILLDLALPGLSAPEFLARMSAEDGCAGSRFVVLTQLVPAAIPPDVRVDGIVLKPLDAADLLEVMRQHCGVD